MGLIFFVTYGIWILSEIIVNRLLRSDKSDKQNVDKGTLYVVWTLIIVGNFLSGFISNWYSLPISTYSIVGYIGLVLILFSVLLRILVISTLGVFFTVDVTIKQNHKLKNDGFYAYVRHPSYSASLLSFIGFGISLNNWLSLILATLFAFLAFIIRIKVEEDALVEHFGSEYLNYKKKTKKLIPFIY